MFSVFNTRVTGLRDEHYVVDSIISRGVSQTPWQTLQPSVDSTDVSALATGKKNTGYREGWVDCPAVRRGDNQAASFITTAYPFNGISGRAAGRLLVMPAAVPRVPFSATLFPFRPSQSAEVDERSGLSKKTIGVKADDIRRGFRQSDEGNCVTVAAIKVAMARFGQSPKSIFAKVEKTAKGYSVTLRDGYHLRLSDQELSQAARGAKFTGRDIGMLKDANFLFAVSAKRAQEENNDGKAGASFRAAISSLNDGEDEKETGEALKRLGLGNYLKKASVSELASGQLGMVNTDTHSVAVIGGHEELWGNRGGRPRDGQAIALR
ncbi:hypothetical protein [Pseudomonas sp. EA_15y_Pfl1_P102]|uniref:hypothetical protein n=1 Tax=Pseudomonas sp. EA_15y_Pfl1_P102 TaxID=3088685 RepID=UPI0030D9F939